MTCAFARLKAGLIVLLVGLVAAAGLVLRSPAPTHAQYTGADQPPDPKLLTTAPLPSSTQRELVGPSLLLRSGVVDMETQTVTLPLLSGRMKNGKKVWYVITDTTDRGNAESLGLNYSSKLMYSGVGRGARVANIDKDGSLVFESGAVDFSPGRKVEAGSKASPFPPKTAEPGSVGDRDYSPLVRVVNAGSHLYNAPIIAFGVEATQIAFCDGKPDHRLVHDRVVKICPEKGTVTLQLTLGFAFGRPVFYISTDSSERGVAAMEASTYSPGLADIPTGHDDAPFSAVERIFVIANGATGADHPHRQGLASALVDGRPPLNVLGGIPTITNDYSPLWDVHMGVWTEDAIKKGVRARVTDAIQVVSLAQQGLLTGPGGKKFASVGVIVNCPIVSRVF